MRTFGWLVVVVALLSAPVLAFDKGASLWVAGDGVALLADAKDKAKTLQPLARGTEVKWLGPSPKDKRFHQVEVGGKKGFVLLSQLTPNKPAVETITADNAPKPANGPAPFVAPAANNPQEAAAFEQLKQLEDLNRAVTAADLDRKQKDVK